MNVFRFLDETVRGAILFVFGFLYVTAVLIRHPLTGPTKIFHAYKSSGSERLSSLTYLALAMLLTIGFVRQVIAGDWGVIPQSALSTARQMFGGDTDSFVPAVLGALAGTMVLAGFLRALAWWRGLTGRKRERFISGSEYAFGVATLMIVIILALYEFTYELEDAGRIGPSVAGGLVGLVLAPVYMICGLLIVAQSWTGLMRDPRIVRFARQTQRLLQVRHKQGRKKTRQARKEMTRRLLGYRDGEKVTIISYLARSMKASGLGALVVMAPFLVSGPALLAGSYIAELAGAKEEPLRILSMTCDLESPQPMASAAIWNSSDEPVAGWLADLRIHIDTALPPDQARIRVPLSWEPRIQGGRVTDFLGPGQSVEVTGPVGIPPEAAAAVRDGAGAFCTGRLGEDMSVLSDRVIHPATRLAHGRLTP